MLESMRRLQLDSILAFSIIVFRNSLICYRLLGPLFISCSKAITEHEYLKLWHEIILKELCVLGVWIACISLHQHLNNTILFAAAVLLCNLLSATK